MESLPLKLIIELKFAGIKKGDLVLSEIDEKDDRLIPKPGQWVYFTVQNYHPLGSQRQIINVIIHENI